MKSKLREAEEHHDKFTKYLVRDHEKNQIGWFTVNEMNSEKNKHKIFLVGNDYWDTVSMEWYSVHAHRFGTL